MSHKRKLSLRSLHKNLTRDTDINAGTSVNTYLRPDGKPGLSITNPSGMTLHDLMGETTVIKYLTQIRIALDRPGICVCPIGPEAGPIEGYAVYDPGDDMCMTETFPTEVEAVLECWKLTKHHLGLHEGSELPNLPGVFLKEA